jgi:hypothetical protein
MNPTVSAAVEQFVMTAQDLSAAWSVSSLVYSADGNTASAFFINTNGDTATVKTTLYPDQGTAQTQYATLKSGYRVTVPVNIPDEAFSWTTGSSAGITFRKGQVIVITEYVSANGPATETMAKSLAQIANTKI